jgi:colicin import membrane protein/protein TonB
VSRSLDSALVRRDRLWPALIASVAVHAVLGGLAIQRRGPSIDASQQPIIARLVRLGEPRPRELLPRKVEPPPAADARPDAAPVPAAPAAPAPRPGPSAQAVATPRATSRPASERSGGARNGRRLSSVISGMKQELAEGSPDGDPLGDSSEAVGDQYLAQVVRALRQNYRVPSTIGERERLYLQGTIVLFIEPDGRVLRHEFSKRSGNPVFDDALERAVRDTRLPPPPSDAREAYRRRGLQVDFKI